MAQLVQNVIESYRDIMDNKSDPRVNDWFMMSSPFPVIAISTSYAIFVTSIGPKLMENRKPFEFKNTLIIYNAIQVVISAWLFYESGVAGWFTHYNYSCQPVDFSNNPLAVRMAEITWWYLMSKFTEFFDTFFFVMRKKNNQISTLHVIHHGLMPVSVWSGVKFFPGGNSTFFGFLNLFVHIIMYTYYMLAAMGPQVQKYLWWKKYLTLLQIVQFVLVIIHSTQIFFIECDYPTGYSYVIGAHGLLFLWLFTNFYRKQYIRNKDRKARKDTVTNGKQISNDISNEQNALYECENKSRPLTNEHTKEEDVLRRRTVTAQHDA